MQRLPFLAFSVVTLGAGAVLGLVSQPALAQVGVALPAFVKLQANTPGIAQTGHSNITGTSIAGQFVGGGAGLTAVNADLLDGINSTAFLQSVPNPLILTGSNPLTSTIRGTNTSNSAGSTGVYGAATGTTAFVN